MNDGEQPGSNRGTLWVKPARLTPETEEGVLDHVFCIARVRRDPDGEAVGEGSVAVVQR